MHVRITTHKNCSGKKRFYTQIVESYRRDDGMPATRVIAHLGVQDKIFIKNLKAALKNSKKGKLVNHYQQTSENNPLAKIDFNENLKYLPLAIISYFFRLFGLKKIIEKIAPAPVSAASVAEVIEALVIQRCIEPDSKLAFQKWLNTVALEEILDVPISKLNNTRVHRVMTELSDLDKSLQEKIQHQIVSKGIPRVLYFDLTDTWFESGGGSLASRGKTKEGHRSKKKIHIALLVNEDGLPIRWRLLPGALSETTVLPKWVDYLSNHSELNNAVLIFDRGMPSGKNFKKLIDDNKGHLFLTSVKSDSIPTYVDLNVKYLDELQEIPDEAPLETVSKQCEKLGLSHYQDGTYVLDVGLLSIQKPEKGKRQIPPDMRAYIYFNREIQKTKRNNRREKFEKVEEYIKQLNIELRNAKQPRKEVAINKKIIRLLDKLKLSEIYEIKLEPYYVQGKTKLINSFQVTLKQRVKMLCNMCRYDGLSLLLGHPRLNMTVNEAILAYRQKNVVEADFRTIKSVLDLRPIYHFTDHKIKSHVTICVLALLIERLIELMLKNNSDKEGMPTTTSSLINELSHIYLNRITVNGTKYIGRTKETSGDRELLRSIGTEHLLESYPYSVEVSM